MFILRSSAGTWLTDIRIRHQTMTVSFLKSTRLTAVTAMGILMRHHRRHSSSQVRCVAATVWRLRPNYHAQVVTSICYHRWHPKLVNFGHHRTTLCQIFAQFRRTYDCISRWFTRHWRNVLLRYRIAWSNYQLRFLNYPSQKLLRTRFWPVFLSRTDTLCSVHSFQSVAPCCLPASTVLAAYRHVTNSFSTM
jgi:hypothetical protein